MARKMGLKAPFPSNPFLRFGVELVFDVRAVEFSYLWEVSGPGPSYSSCVSCRLFFAAKHRLLLSGQQRVRPAHSHVRVQTVHAAPGKYRVVRVLGKPAQRSTAGLVNPISCAGAMSRLGPGLAKNSSMASRICWSTTENSCGAI